jgi:hypothetical protein
MRIPIRKEGDKIVSVSGDELSANFLASHPHNIEEGWIELSLTEQEKSELLAHVTQSAGKLLMVAFKSCELQNSLSSELEHNGDRFLLTFKKLPKPIAPVNIDAE